jgi:hypothetical protein
MLEVLIASVVLISIAVLGMGVNLIIRNKKFPNTHIGGNKEMIKRGIYCAKTMDKIENKKAIEEIKYKNLKHVKLADS